MPTFLTRWRVLATMLMFVIASATSAARAVEHNFAGSVQLDQHFVPTASPADARRLGFAGFTLEAAGKLAVDFSERVSANVKVCFGCHGFETDMAHFDYRASDGFRVRFGRMSPTFGLFNLRHDPANHKLSSKPLPYDMGRMLRHRAWNQGVLPSPFPDNGVEISGTHAGEAVTLEYAAHAVSGMKADARALDLDFVQSRTGGLYYVDNNALPTVGGRVAANIRLAPRVELGAGASGLAGTFDPNNERTYAVLGGDLALRVGRTQLRAEYLLRRQEFDTSDPSRFKYVLSPRGEFFVKHGAYAEIEQPLSSSVDAVFRVDGMMRVGNLERPAPLDPAPEGELSRRSSVGRVTVGSVWAVDAALRLKTSVEVTHFSDRDLAGRRDAVGVHVAGVGTF